MRTLCTLLAASSGSLHPDTPITLDDGSTKALSAVALGDTVRSWNFGSDRPTGEMVEAVWRSKGDLYQFNLGNRSVVATADHPFWSCSQHSLVSLQPEVTKSNYGFEVVEEITETTVLFATDGSEAPFLGATLVETEVEVITLSVENHHWFFAGGILVHNRRRRSRGSNNGNGEDNEITAWLNGETGPPTTVLVTGGVVLFFFALVIALVIYKKVTGEAFNFDNCCSCSCTSSGANQNPVMKEVLSLKTCSDTLPENFPKMEDWTGSYGHENLDGDKAPVSLSLIFAPDGSVSGSRRRRDEPVNIQGKYNSSTLEVKWAEIWNAEPITTASGTMVIDSAANRVEIRGRGKSIESETESDFLFACPMRSGEMFVGAYNESGEAPTQGYTTQAAVVHVPANQVVVTATLVGNPA